MLDEPFLLCLFQVCVVNTFVSDSQYGRLHMILTLFNKITAVERSHVKPCTNVKLDANCYFCILKQSFPVFSVHTVHLSVTRLYKCIDTFESK